MTMGVGISVADGNLMVLGKKRLGTAKRRHRRDLESFDFLPGDLESAKQLLRFGSEGSRIYMVWTSFDFEKRLSTKSISCILAFKIAFSGPFCQRVLLTLEEKHVPYDLKEQSVLVTTLIVALCSLYWYEFLKINLEGKVPVKNLDEKWVSDVITQALEEKFPSPPLGTPPEKASVF
ncbi:hypothetical protein K1719_044712 [Acacia pycnantha]|nr:hypothetical protein K1719_044712 [Acacia pycnantha]